jgi:hypothetical protein
VAVVPARAAVLAVTVGGAAARPVVAPSVVARPVDARPVAAPSVVARPVAAAFAL